LSNFALSAGEDALAVLLTWLATRHPIAAALIVAAFLSVIVAATRWVFRATTRALKSLFTDAENDLVPSKRRDLNAA